METDEEHQVAKEFSPAFSIEVPKGGAPNSPVTPFVFDSPHSGSHYPSSFLRTSRLDPITLRRSEDFYVDELFQSMPRYGASLIKAHFPRAYLDVNREPFELDPALISGRLPKFANTRSLRVAGGLGTVPRVVTEGRNIYRSPISLNEAMARIRMLYKPYHQALRQLLNSAVAEFGFAVLIDCHSMPSLAGGEAKGRAVDFVLGDRFGTSCSVKLTRFIARGLTDLGYLVVLNKPYAGGYVTESYGKPRDHIHALQIEINRGLYMNEDDLGKTPGFKTLQKDLAVVMQELIGEMPDRLYGYRTAAE